MHNCSYLSVDGMKAADRPREGREETGGRGKGGRGTKEREWGGKFSPST